MANSTVATPGRLVDHISDTPGFTLQHLQFLVVDEADRLLMQSYYDWLPKVLDALQESHEGQILDDDGYGPMCHVFILQGDNFRCLHPSYLWPPTRSYPVPSCRSDGYLVLTLASSKNYSFPPPLHIIQRRLPALS